MWREYIGKKILVTPLDRDDDSGRYRPIEMIVLKVLEIHLNTLVYILNEDFRFDWIYPAEYIVINEEIISTEEDAWHEHIGKRLLTRRGYEGSVGEPREWTIIRTKGVHVMVLELSSYIGDNGRPRTVWKDTTGVEILGVI